MTERTLGAVRKRLRAGQHACWMADSSHGPCPPDFFAIFAPLLAEVVEVEVDSTQPLLLCLRSRGRGSRRSRGRPGGRGRRRRGRAGRGLVILKIGRVLELVFRPRHFQLDVGRVVRAAGRSVVAVLTAGIGRHSVECTHVNGNVLRANAEEPAYAYDHANDLSGPVNGVCRGQEFTASVAVKNSQRYETLETSGLQQSHRICSEPTSLTRTDNSLRAYDYEAPICKEDGTANLRRSPMGGHYSDPRSF